MIQEFLISLFTDLVVGPVQAEIAAKFATERAPPEIVAQVTNCVSAAPKALATRAMADPVWGASMAFRVWSAAITPEGMLREAVPGCEPALSAAKPYLSQLGV